MINRYDEQFFKIQLKWAADAFDAERRMRLAADERVVAARGLLMELAMHLLTAELDDVRKQQDVTKWTDAQLVRWLKDLLSHYLFQLRSSTGDAARHRLEQAAQEMTRLKAENVQLSKQHLLNQAEAKRVATYQATIAEQQVQIKRLQRELADARDDLEITRSQAARPTEPPLVIIEMPVVEESFVPPQPQKSSTPSSADWYAAWQQATAPETFDRQQKIIQVIGEGEAFFRVEIVAKLNVAGLLRDDPDRPSGTLHRLFAALSDQGLIAEIDGGYGASVARPLVLTERGREAYQRFTGQTLSESLYQRLLNRHKTVEHTVLNLMARQVLRRFQYTAIDLFPDSRRTPTGAVVIPDLTAVSPDGEMLLIECERLAKHHTAAARQNKWGDLAALTQGQFHVVVPGGHQQRDLITEVSQWIIETDTKQARLAICQYAKAIKPEATALWTYQTDWALA
jgi:hypothetical protein